MGYTHPGIITDTDEPIKAESGGIVWKAGGGKTGFKASYEAVSVLYRPSNPEGEQFVISTSTPIGGSEVSTHGTKQEAVSAAISYGQKYMATKFSKISF